MIAESPRVRMSVLGIVVFALFAALFARLYYLQVMASDQYQVAAQANRIRVVPVEAPRGRILDRNGKVLVDNRISVQVTIDRTVVNELEDDERGRVLTAVADGLARSGTPKTVEQLEDDLGNLRYSPYVPVPVAGDVPEELKIWIDEHGADLPGVAAERVAVRRYPYGQLAAPVLGYTGQIIDAEFEEKADSRKPYTLNDEIGKYGVEKIYEDDLRGTPGSREIEVDAENNPVRVVDETEPIPGDDIVLNLDIDVQAHAEQALQSGLKIAQTRPCSGCPVLPKAEVGSTVVLDPKTGGVLAMASFPRFDPSAFVDGISDSEWAALTDEENNAPLNNWAIQGQYAPGSTFKPFSAVSALEAGLITPDTTVYDDGVYEVPDCTGDSCAFSNDREKQYGVVDLRRSLTVSSDFYYYGLGARFWIEQDRLGGGEKYADLLKRWGFDSDSGIDLSSEQSGRIPSPSWLDDYCESVGCVDGAETWRTGNNVNMAIGQGDVLLTPLQIASGYATIGNGGTVWQPHVVKEVRDGVTKELKRTIEPKQIGTIEMRPEWRAALLDGLTGVTTQAGGTAVGAFSGFPTNEFPIAAKTGTAQVSGKAPTAVFGAFGPATDAQYAISVLLEEAGYGGSVAAPVARRLFDVLRDPALLTPAPEGGDFELLPSLAPITTDDVRD
ncbi:MAG: penicillin-binding protein 2 [Acidimicrobiales bacterium]